MKKVALLFCFVVTIAASARAQVTGSTTLTVNVDYYVATTGNDANIGSSAHPWATIQHAASTVPPYSTVHVAAGTYATSTYLASSTAHVRYISDTQWAAKIVTSATEAWDNTGAYVDIMGFDISGNGNTVIGIHSEGNFERSIGNRIHDMGSTGCQSGAGIMMGDGGVGNTNESAIANMIFNIGPLPPAVPGCNQIQGIYDVISGAAILNNITFNIAAKGIQVYGEASGEATYCVIANNTSFGNQDGMVIGASGTGGSLLDDAIVSNNIFYGNVRYGLYEEGSLGTNNQYLNNLINGNPSGTSMVSGSLVSTVTTAPQFVNFTGDSTGNYQLNSTSPAINAGTPTGAPSTDFVGGARPQGRWDIGAYEYLATPGVWPWL